MNIRRTRKHFTPKWTMVLVNALTAHYQAKWDTAVGPGISRCPYILRHPDTDWDKVAASRAWWLEETYTG